MAEKTRNIAVLTGDLVNSTALGPEKTDRAMRALAQCAGVQEAWHGAPLHFTRNRGDGWQVVLARPEMALRSALAFRAALRAEGSEFDTRMLVANGPGPGPNEIDPDLNDQTGPLFTESGRGLDAMKSAINADIRMFCTGGSHEGPSAAAFILADHISRHWTETQARTTLPFLTPENDLSYTDVARALGKSRQAVTKAAQAAGLTAINNAVISFEGTQDSSK